MDHGYQKIDEKIVDYEIYKLADCTQKLRGPKPERLEKNNYFTCLGAAQTFGRFCQKPYPQLLSEAIGFPVLNLGMAGAGPTAYSQRPKLMKYINQGRFTIIQIMSGRSVSNSLLEQHHHGGTVIPRNQPNADPAYAQHAYADLIKTLDVPELQKIIAETRTNWVSSMQDLLSAINVPKILLWFSNRDEEYKIQYSSVSKVFGGFPQMVNLEMVEQIKSGCDTYVKCVSSSGMPQPLLSRETGQHISITKPDGSIVDYNRYYPSPEMQQNASDALYDCAVRFRDSDQGGITQKRPDNQQRA